MVADNLFELLQWILLLYLLLRGRFTRFPKDQYVSLSRIKEDQNE